MELKFSDFGKKLWKGLKQNSSPTLFIFSHGIRDHLKAQEHSVLAQRYQQVADGEENAEHLHRV
jgi:hypothetical protein